MSQLPRTRRRNNTAPPQTSPARGGEYEIVFISLPKRGATPEKILFEVFAHYGLRGEAEIEAALDDPNYIEFAVAELKKDKMPANVAKVPDGKKYAENWRISLPMVEKIRAYKASARADAAARAQPSRIEESPPLIFPPLDPMLAPPSVPPNAPAGGGGPGKFRNPAADGMGEAGAPHRHPPLDDLPSFDIGIDGSPRLRNVAAAFLRAQVHRASGLG